MHNHSKPRCLSPQPFRNSVLSPTYKIVPQQSLPNVSVLVKSEKNTPLMLYIKSSDSVTLQKLKFQAGEAYLPNSTLLKSHIPNISTFELYDQNDKNPENSNSIAKNERFQQCRICLEYEISEVLLSPCLCKGHQKYVHENCLKTWLLKSEKSEKDLTACEVCKGKFRMTFTYSREFKCFSRTSLRFWIALIFVLASVAFFLMLLTIEEVRESLGNEELRGTCFGIGAFGLLSMICCCCYCKSSIGNKQVTDWEILNLVEERTDLH